MKFRSYKGLLILVIAAGIISSNYFFCSKSSDKNVFGITTEESPIKNDSDVSNMIEAQNVFRKIYTLYENRVVFISTEQTVKMPYNPFYELFDIPSEQKRTGLGSGFVISEDGYICTNFHVIAPDGASIVDKITVGIGTDSYPAELRGFDEHKDIAILKVDPKKKLNPVFFGDSAETKVGDWAIAIGNPFGLSRSFTVGNVSAVGRTNIGEEGEPYIQTDAVINPGNSGGPLINIKGEVIGINQMIFSRSGGYQGIGFAIPINSVKENFESLKKQKHLQKGYVGIQLIPLTDEVRAYHRWNQNYGAVVKNVMPDGPAHEAGLIRGDIIFGVNGKKVVSVNLLTREIERAGANARIELDVFRRGTKMKFYLVTRAEPQQ